MPSPDPKGKPLARESVEERQMDRDLCLFDATDRNNQVHLLNSGAALVWYLCDGEHRVEGIAREIAITFARPYPEVLAQVRETVAQFHSLNLVQML